MSTSLQTFGFERDQVDLIKATIAKGCTDDELGLFLITATRLQLDPFAKQIYAVKRWDSKAEREVMAIQVGIDGLRSVADRTGCYAPGGDHRCEYVEVKGQRLLVRMTATVKKLVAGTWHEVERSAYWDEYVQLAKNGGPMPMWRDKPHVMLGKCAEAQALRAAFPQLGGAYIPEEMEREIVEVEAATIAPKTTAPIVPDALSNDEVRVLLDAASTGPEVAVLIKQHRPEAVSDKGHPVHVHGKGVIARLNAAKAAAGVAA